MLAEKQVSGVFISGSFSGGRLEYSLEVLGLTKVYPGPSSFWMTSTPRRAVDDVTLRIKSGEVYGFLGKNGAGKTTTLKVVLSLIAPTAGEVRLFGKDAGDPRERRRIGFAPEQASFYTYLTAAETLRYLGGLSGLKGNHLETRIQQTLEMVSLEKETHSYVRTFSKGMQQRLGMAQSLLTEPDILIFDEPTTGLDPFGRKFFKNLILRLKAEGRTVFFSSHQLLDVQEICDRIGIIHHGKLVFEGTVSDLLQGERSLEEKFVERILALDNDAGRQTRID